MRKSINLINQEAQKTIRLLRLKKQIKNTVFVFVGGFVFLTFLVLLAFFALSQVYKGNQAKIVGLKEQIKTLEKNESYAVVIANRVKGINTILKTRKSYLEAMTELESLFVPGFELESLEVSKEGNLKISGACSDLFSLQAFNGQVEKIHQQNKYGRITYPSVSRMAQGEYNVFLELRHE